MDMDVTRYLGSEKHRLGRPQKNVKENACGSSNLLRGLTTQLTAPPGRPEASADVGEEQEAAEEAHDNARAGLPKNVDAHLYKWQLVKKVHELHQPKPAVSCASSLDQPSESVGAHPLLCWDTPASWRSAWRLACSRAFKIVEQLLLFHSITIIYDRVLYVLNRVLFRMFSGVWDCVTY